MSALDADALAAIRARAAQVAHNLEAAQETRVLVARGECSQAWAKIHDDAWREAKSESADDVPALLAHIDALHAAHAAAVAAARADALREAADDLDAAAPTILGTPTAAQLRVARMTIKSVCGWLRAHALATGGAS